MTINICEDFNNLVGTRYRSQGNFSGEQFRDEILEPKYLNVRESNEKLIINLDGGYGYTTSFLEEAFGGLARKYSSKEVLNVLSFISNDEPSLVGEIKEYIINANNVL